MKRWLYAYRTVRGRPEDLEQRVRTQITQLLRRATDTPDEPAAVDGSFALRLDAPVGRGPAKTVRVTTGVAARADDRTRIPLRWHAEPGRHAFPSFDGTLEFEALSPTRAQLTLVGAYSPPLGPLGAAADATLLAGAARRTADRLVEALGDALEEPEPAPAAPEPTAALSRQLSVADVMTPDPVLLTEDLPLRTAALLLFHHRIGGAPVVAESGELVGVVSEADLLEKEATERHGMGQRAEASQVRRRARTVGEACTRPARVTVPAANLRDAARELADHDIARLVVVEGADIVGIVTRHDVMRALLRSEVELEAAVDAIVAARGATEVRASVEWGVVTLTGQVERRSQLAPLVRAAEAVDGVVAVDADVVWDVDDVTPPTSTLGPSV